MDAGQLLYHIVWASGGTVSTIITSKGATLQPYNALPTTVVFVRYGNVSAKDHERTGATRYQRVCWYLHNNSHFNSSQQRSHYEKQGAQNTPISPSLHMYTGSKYIDGR